MQFNDVPESDISMDEDWPTLSSATIDCPTSSEPAPINGIPPASPNERQRPVRNANRPTRYRDDSFETRFQPVPSRRCCKKMQKPSATGYDAQNAEVRRDLGRGVDYKNIASTGNENTRQKPFLCLKTSYPDPSDDLLATSRLLENKQRRSLQKGKRRIKSTTSPFPPMHIRKEESSIETSPTRQKRLRTAHLQFESTTRVRESTGREIARGSAAAGEVISAAAARRHHRRRPRALIDNQPRPHACRIDIPLFQTVETFPFPSMDRCKVTTTVFWKHPNTQSRVNSVYSDKTYK